MADIADMADDSIELHRAESLRQQLNKGRPESHPDFDGKHCIECNEPVAQERLALHKVRCIDCQVLLEKRRALGLQ